MLEYVRRERDHFVNGVVKEVESIAEGDIVRGQARFEAPARLIVGNHTRVTAQRVVIAVEAAPFVPNELRVFGDKLITSDELFELRMLPRRIAVFGAGPIALELGQALTRLDLDIFMFAKGGSVAALLTDTPVRDTLAGILADAFYFDPAAKFDEMSLRDDKPYMHFRTPDGRARRKTLRPRSRQPGARRICRRSCWRMQTSN